MAEISENAQRNTPVSWLGRDTVAEVSWLMMMLMVDVMAMLAIISLMRMLVMTMVAVVMATLRQ